jgi:hypothetical protein
MPLSPEQEQLEHELRVIQMETYIEKMRRELRDENRKFVLQLLATLAVTIGATAAVTTAVVNYVNHPRSADSVVRK